MILHPMIFGVGKIGDESFFSFIISEGESPVKGNDAVVEDHFFSVKDCINGKSACRKTIKNAVLFPFFQYLLCPKALDSSMRHRRVSFIAYREVCPPFFSPPFSMVHIFFNDSD